MTTLISINPNIASYLLMQTQRHTTGKIPQTGKTSIASRAPR
ncbi:hypothetical protein [Anabaena azotica]